MPSRTAVAVVARRHPTESDTVVPTDLRETGLSFSGPQEVALLPSLSSSLACPTAACPAPFPHHIRSTGKRETAATTHSPAPLSSYGTLVEQERRKRWRAGVPPPCRRPQVRHQCRFPPPLKKEEANGPPLRHGVFSAMGTSPTAAVPIVARCCLPPRRAATDEGKRQKRRAQGLDCRSHDSARRTRGRCLCTAGVGRKACPKRMSCRSVALPQGGDFAIVPPLIEKIGVAVCHCDGCRGSLAGLPIKTPPARGIRFQRWRRSATAQTTPLVSRSLPFEWWSWEGKRRWSGRE